MNSRQRVGVVVGVSVMLLGSVILIPYFLGFGSTDDSEDDIVYQLDSIDYVRITVLVDNNPNGSLIAYWGLSILVETDNLTILFDSGPSPQALEENSEALGIDLGATCDLIVVSHEHRDHVDGLTYLSEIRDDLTLYTPYYNSSHKYWMNGFNVIEVENTTEISFGIAIIGVSYEQALVINVKNLGLVVLVGCGHPGVENLVAGAIHELNVDEVYMVMGGFHLCWAAQDSVISTVEALIDLGVQNIYPLHCSGEYIRNYLESTYPTYYGEACVGFQIVLNGTADTIPIVGI